MRRLLLILLMTLLPLQASWAAVCTYCSGPCDFESETISAQMEQQDSDASSLMSDDDCRCCQPGSVAIAPALGAAALVASPPSFASDAGVIALASFRPDRPERPKWMRAA